MRLGSTAYDRNYQISQLHLDWKYNRHLVENHVFEHGYVLIRHVPCRGSEKLCRWSSSHHPTWISFFSIWAMRRVFQKVWTATWPAARTPTVILTSYSFCAIHLWIKRWRVKPMVALAVWMGKCLYEPKNIPSPALWTSHWQIPYFVNLWYPQFWCPVIHMPLTKNATN